MLKDIDRFKGGAAFVRGNYVPMSEAAISVTDWGFTRSDAVYDVVHVFENRFFRLDDHIARFAGAMARRRFDVGLRIDEIESILHRVASLSRLPDAYVAMAALRGRPRIAGSRRPEDCDNHLIAYAIPWVDVIPKAVQKQGATLWVSTHPRVPDESVDPTVKNYQWSDLTTALFDAHDHGCESAVLCDSSGFVTEGPGFNIFVVKDGRAFTPDRGALPGITRKTVLELCENLRIPCSIAPLTRSDILNADEIFLTSTAGGVMPVGAVKDGRRLRGPMGEVFSTVRDAYWAAHRLPAYSVEVRNTL